TAPQTADEVASLGEMKEEEAAQAGEGLDAGKKMEEAVPGEGHAPEKISALVRELGGLGDVGDVKTVSGAAGGGNVVVKIRLLERS
ncbi:MAG: hypothetical protein P8Y85_05880, partial [Nitrospirota bacterium]